jgi:hypothetical protein
MFDRMPIAARLGLLATAIHLVLRCRVDHLTASAKVSPSEAVGRRSGEAVTGEDCLSAQISEKFVRRSFQVEPPVDDPAVEGVSLARLADQQDRPGVRDFAFDLHRTALVARGDNRRMPIP